MSRTLIRFGFARHVIAPFAPMRDSLSSASFVRSTLHLIFALTLSASTLSATLIPVKYKEGTSHGFVVVRSQEGHTLATGDMIQTVEGEKVKSELVLHFADGSVYDDITIFSQMRDFRLISDHVRQEGKSFSNPDQMASSG